MKPATEESLALVELTRQMNALAMTVRSLYLNARDERDRYFDALMEIVDGESERPAHEIALDAVAERLAYEKAIKVMADAKGDS